MIRILVHSYGEQYEYSDYDIQCNTKGECDFIGSVFTAFDIEPYEASDEIFFKTNLNVLSAEDDLDYQLKVWYDNEDQIADEIYEYIRQFGFDVEIIKK